MVEQTQTEETPVEEAVEKPAEEPKATPRAKRSDIAELQSRYDKQIAETNKRAEANEAALAEANAKLAAMEDYVDLTRKSANISDDEAARLKQMAAWQTDLSKQSSLVQQAQKKVSMDVFSSMYGIPVEELEAYDDPITMENAALKWRMNHPSEPDVVEETPEPEEAVVDEDDDTPPPSRNNFDTGSGTGQSKSLKEMTLKERDEDWKRREAKARSDMLRRR